MTDNPLIPGLGLILVGAWILWGNRLFPSKHSSENSREVAGINEIKLYKGLAPLLIAVGILMTIAGALMSSFGK